MTDLENEILKLYTKGISLNEIQSKLYIPDTIFLKALKNIRENHKLDFKYYSDGKIVQHKNKSNDSNQRIFQTGDNLHVIFYSDLHAGNKRDELDLLDIVYEHAIMENIHILFNTGDVIENIYSVPERCLRQATIEGQISHLLRHFPYSSSITNFILYGNHDHKALTEYGIDVAAILEKERPDLVSLGYGEANVDINNTFITLQHNLTNRKVGVPENANIVFRGHSHKMKIDMRKDAPIIFVPALSNALPESYTYPPIPGFLDVTFTFTHEGQIDKVYIIGFNTEKKLNQVSECVLTLKKTI